MVYLPTLLSYPPTPVSLAPPHPHPCPLAMVYARAVPSPTLAVVPEAAATMKRGPSMEVDLVTGTSSGGFTHQCECWGQAGDHAEGNRWN